MKYSEYKAKKEFPHSNDELTESDFIKFEENLDKCICDLVYIDKNSSKSQMKEILECAKLLGWGPKNESGAIKIIHNLFDDCMNDIKTRMRASFGGWCVECELEDHTVLVTWNVAETCNYD